MLFITFHHLGIAFIRSFCRTVGGVPVRRLPNHRRTLQTLEIRKLQLHNVLLLVAVPSPLRRAGRGRANPHGPLQPLPRRVRRVMDDSNQRVRLRDH